MGLYESIFTTTDNGRFAIYSVGTGIDKIILPKDSEIWGNDTERYVLVAFQHGGDGLNGQWMAWGVKTQKLSTLMQIEGKLVTAPGTKGGDLKKVWGKDTGVPDQGKAPVPATGQLWIMSGTMFVLSTVSSVHDDDYTVKTQGGVKKVWNAYNLIAPLSFGSDINACLKMSPRKQVGNTLPACAFIMEP